MGYRKMITWFNTKGNRKEELHDEQSMSPLECVEVKEGAGMKILTPNKLLIKLPVLLVQI